MSTTRLHNGLVAEQGTKNVGATIAPKKGARSASTFLAADAEQVEAARKLHTVHVIAETYRKLKEFKDLLVEARSDQARKHIWTNYNTSTRNIFCGGKYGSTDELGLSPVTVLENLYFIYEKFPLECVYSFIENPYFINLMNQSQEDGMDLFCERNAARTFDILTSIEDIDLITAIKKTFNGQFEVAFMKYLDHQLDSDCLPFESENSVKQEENDNAPSNFWSIHALFSTPKIDFSDTPTLGVTLDEMPSLVDVDVHLTYPPP